MTDPIKDDVERVTRAIAERRDGIMEELSKLYLELANVVPTDCISVREKALQKHIDRYGLALMMIAEGAADPRDIANDALSQSPTLGEKYRKHLEEMRSRP